MNGTAMSLKAAKSETVGGWRDGWETAAPDPYLPLPLSGRQQLNASVSHTCDHLAGAARSLGATQLHTGRSRNPRAKWEGCVWRKDNSLKTPNTVEMVSLAAC